MKTRPPVVFSLAIMAGRVMRLYDSVVTLALHIILLSLRVSKLSDCTLNMQVN